jgi:O-antigen/teichoic acid export membrane protein
LIHSTSLVPAVAVLIVVRLMGLMSHVVLCLKYVPALRRTIGFSYNTIRPLLTFGGWMTVSNIIGPLMVYFDRFLIGSLISLTAVAYYTTPYEVVTKLWIIPGALAGVLFPAFATAWVENKKQLSNLFDNGLKYTFILLFPVSFVVVLFASEGLDIWLGGDFASKSARVMQWLMVGVFLNSLAQITFCLVQGVGRPDITAKLHVVQFFPYLLVLWWLLEKYGIEGAAIAWVARVAVDLIALMIVARYLVGGIDKIMLRYFSIVVMAAVALAVGMLLQGLSYRVWFFSIVFVLFLLFVWRSSKYELALVVARFKN